MKKFMLFLLVIVAVFLYACKEEEQIYIELPVTEVEIDEGTQYTIEVVTNAPGELHWESSDESIATVENGVVTALNDGFVEITISYDGAIESFYLVINKVKFKPTYHTLTINGDPVEVLQDTTIYKNLQNYYGGYTYEPLGDATFEGWYLDEEYTQECDLQTVITGDVSVYAKYKYVEVESELRLQISEIVGAGKKFSEKEAVQNIIPTYGATFNITSDLLNKFSFIEVKYNPSVEDYFVTKIITEASDYKIPSNGFIVSIKKDLEDYNTYMSTLTVGQKITLGTYSALTSKSLYVNEVINTDVDELNLGDSSITTKYCTVYDVRSKKVLYSKAGDTKAWPASTTKIVTAIAALKYANLSDTVVIGDELDICYEGSSPSTCGLVKGETWTLEQLLYGLLLPSGNDAGYGIAALTINSMYPNNTYTAKEKVEMFAELMNEVCRDCGATNSKFYTPDGNSYYNKDGSYQERTENHTVTAADMVKIGVYAFSFPAICEVVRTPSKSVTLPSGQIKSFNITNALIKPTNSNYYEGAVGLKTGTTNRAGACLVSGVERQRRFIVVASLGNPNSTSRYTNTLIVFRAIFGNN